MKSANLPSIATLKAAARAGDQIARDNIPVAYRDLGKLRLAFAWSKRLASEGDGDAALDVGYAYQYGIGVRRNPRLAGAAYRQAIRARRITDYGREEAMYHFAVLLLDEGLAPGRRGRAASLLARANQDGDFPAAALLARQLAESVQLAPCRCRRGFSRDIKGQARCPRHHRNVTRRSSSPSSTVHSRHSARPNYRFSRRGAGANSVGAVPLYPAATSPRG